MQVAELTAIPSEHLHISEAPRPTIQASDEVILRVEACGVCGTDLHMLAGNSYRPDLPFILGHEPVGVVIEAGPGARTWLDHRATMTLFTGDGTCRWCRDGDERLCRNLESITGVLGIPGGYAEYIRVRARQLVRVPESLPSPVAASLVDSGATAANSVRVATEWAPESALVLGAGPIGYICAELLRMHGVGYEVIEPAPTRRQAMIDRGHPTRQSSQETPEPVDVIIDCTGSPRAMASSLGHLQPHGLYVLAGYARVPNLDLGAVARIEASIRGIRSGRRSDLEYLLDLVATGKVKTPGLDLWRLSEVNDALDALRGGEVQGKAIVVPDSAWEA